MVTISANNTADTLLYNCKARTMVKGDDKVYGAVGIKDGRISFVGTAEEAAEVEAKERVDLRGALVLPGFIDTHLHLLNFALSLRQLNLASAESLDDVFGLIGAHIASSGWHKRKGFVYARGFNQNKLRETRYPTLQELDALCPEIPLYIERACGHIAIVNSKALEFVKKAGGYAGLRDSVKEEEGLLLENAMGLFREGFGEDKTEDSRLEPLIMEGAQSLNAAGICSCGSNNYFGDDSIALLYERLARAGDLSVRVSQQCTLTDTESLKRFLETDYYGDDFFRMGPLKLYSDGSLGAWTASLNEPYADRPDMGCGVDVFTQNELDALVSLADKNGRQVIIHAIGDKAAESSVSAIVKALSGRENALRHGIVHAQITTPEIIREMSEHGICAFIQPTFLEEDMLIVRERLGEERAAMSYAFRDMIRSGIVTGGGSDAPVDDISVLRAIYHAVTRKRLDGTEFRPEQGLSVDEAVAMYTREAAKLTHDEEVKGTLEAGKFADICVVSEDIFDISPDKIKDVRVLKTIVGGKAVHE